MCAKRMGRRGGVGCVLLGVSAVTDVDEYQGSPQSKKELITERPGSDDVIVERMLV